jgi:hypothetical protein
VDKPNEPPVPTGKELQKASNPVFSKQDATAIERRFSDLGIPKTDSKRLTELKGEAAAWASRTPDFEAPTDKMYTDLPTNAGQEANYLKKFGLSRKGPLIVFGEKPKQFTQEDFRNYRRNFQKVFNSRRKKSIRKNSTK